MRAISVRQPWASLLAWGDKTVEVRTWSTTHRGPLLICASGRDVVAEDIILPAGYALAVAELVDVRPLARADLGAACLDGMPDRPSYAWIIKNAREVSPFPVVGQLRLFEVDKTPSILRHGNHVDIIAALRAAS